MLKTRDDPPLTAEEQARAVATLRAFNRPDPADARAWARRLRFRELAGERLTEYQRNAWREALGERPLVRAGLQDPL